MGARINVTPIRRLTVVNVLALVGGTAGAMTVTGNARHCDAGWGDHDEDDGVSCGASEDSESVQLSTENPGKYYLGQCQ
jgi:hypothetical protein